MQGMNDQIIDLGVQLGTELEEKNRLLDEYTNDQPIEKVVQARIQQLAITKVLVKVHGRHKSLLAKAHCDLGESYMMKEFFEQALYHFSIAKEINSGLFDDYEESKQFHPFILMMLGKCYIEQQKYNEALEYLEKALKINEQQIAKDHISNVNIITDLAFVYTKKSNFSTALKLYYKAISIIEGSGVSQKETLASLYLDVAKTQEPLGNLKEAISYQQKALDILRAIEGIDNIVLANICATLSDWCTKDKQYKIALDAIKGSIQAYEEAYGKEDLKTIKFNEKSADILYAAGNIEEAINKLKEVEEFERTLFGNMNIKVGKICKKLAMWLKESNREEEAGEYVERSSKIFGAKKVPNKKQDVNMSIDSSLNPKDNGVKFSKRNVSTESGRRPKDPRNIKKSKRVIIRKSNY